MASASKLEALLEVIRSAKCAEDTARSEEAFFEALLDTTVYAHSPSGSIPPGRVRFVQFRRPDNGQTVLPFFTDLAQAKVPLSPERALVSMTGRELFEWTRGATLMMNPNREQAALYPAEIEALLEGRPLGRFGREPITLGDLTDGCPPSIPADDLVIALRNCFASEPMVSAGYLVEVLQNHEQQTETILLLVVVAPRMHAERLVHLISLVLQTSRPDISLPLTMVCHSAEEDLPAICDRGIQFYGT